MTIASLPRTSPDHRSTHLMHKLPATRHDQVMP